MSERKLVLVFSTIDPSRFRTVVGRLSRLAPGRGIVAVTPAANRSELADVVYAAAENGHEQSIGGSGFDLSGHTFREVFVYAPGGKQQPLPPLLLHEIFSRDLDRILAIDEQGRLSPYAPYRHRKARILSVFPGPMVPLNLGSHQRGFNLVSYLNAHGEACDVLISACKSAQIGRPDTLLTAICPRVHMFRNTKRRLPKIRRAQQRLEQLWRRLRRRPGNPPELFTDRAYLRPTTSAKKRLAKLIESEGYDTVIVNYAWMMDVLELVADRSRIKVIVDTHDVQFVRDQQRLSGEKLLFHNPVRQREAELGALRRADTVLAISASDHAILEAELPDRTVLCVPTGFDYALVPTKARPSGRPLGFGFIGTNMEANVRALTFIVESWWPIIRRFSPESTLKVAGTIGANDEIQRSCFLDDSIALLGRVDSIRAFYQQVDIILSPVLVQGGLNFKTVEAIMAGKHLFTNRLGSLCLGNADMATVIDTAGDIERALMQLETDPAAELAFRKRRQWLASFQFTEKAAYAALVAHLGGSPERVALADAA